MPALPPTQTIYIGFFSDQPWLDGNLNLIQLDGDIVRHESTQKFRSCLSPMIIYLSSALRWMDDRLSINKWKWHHLWIQIDIIDHSDYQKKVFAKS